MTARGCLRNVPGFLQSLLTLQRTCRHGQNNQSITASKLSVAGGYLGGVALVLRHPLRRVGGVGFRVKGVEAPQDSAGAETSKIIHDRKQWHGC